MAGLRWCRYMRKPVAAGAYHCGNGVPIDASVGEDYTCRECALSRPAANLVEREAHRLPSDAFQKCAVRALRGDWGVIPDWKRDAYIWGLARGVEVCGAAKVTSYGYLWEPGGTIMATGKRVYVGACAANPEIPFGCIVWTAAYGLARVEDRGGWVKVGFARVHGRRRYVTNRRETANFDYYSIRELPTVRNCPWARVKN